MSNLFESAAEAVIEACGNEYIKHKAHLFIKEYRKQILKWIDKRESIHGKCPESVVDDLTNQAIFECGRWLVKYAEIKAYFCPRPPGKGTRARKDYDSWMKRKAKSEIVKHAITSLQR